jgi:SAM-dependent methyltransferase
MSAQDRQHWDTVYRERGLVPYPPPDPLLFEYVPPLPAEGEAEVRALDLAGGVGQNGLWLAAQGYTVDIVDISRAGLKLAQDEMGRRRLRTVNLYPVDLDDYTLPEAAYAVICVFRFLKRDYFPQLRAALQPGGRILYETFNRNYLATARDFNPAFVLEEGELAGYFADWKIIHHVEGRRASSIVAVKP